MNFVEDEDGFIKIKDFLELYIIHLLLLVMKTLLILKDGYVHIGEKITLYGIIV